MDSRQQLRRQPFSCRRVRNPSISRMLPTMGRRCCRFQKFRVMLVSPMPHRTQRMACRQGVTRAAGQLLLRQLLQQGLHIPVKADVVRHSRSPPNRFRSLCRRRYSRPSAARSVMPSSAAIWAVDWQ